MSHFRLLISAFLLCTIASSSLYSQNKKLDKTLKKVDSYYNAGNFPKAFKSLSKFKSGVVKLGSPGNYMVDLYVREARLNLSSGMLPAFEEAVKNALALSEKTYGVSSKSYVTTLLDVAELYNEYGNYRMAVGYCTTSREILTKSGIMDEAFNARLTLTEAEALTGQGFCNQAIEQLRTVEEYLAKRAVQKETVVEAGAIKTKRIADEEIPGRFEAYAKFLTLTANAYSKKGDLLSADSAFIAAKTWIRKNQGYLGESSLALVTTNYLYAKMLVENGNEERENSLEFDNILNDLKKQAAPTHTLAHDVYLAYLQYLIEKEYNSRYYNVKMEYERKLGKYFPRKSIVNANLSAIEFNKKLAKDKTRDIEKNALAMLNSKEVPKNYKTTENILSFLTEVALTEKLYANAETYLTQICDIKKELCGENSPDYHLARLNLASYYMDYTSKLDQAGKIFEESYLKVVGPQIDERHKDHLTILNHLAKYYELTDKYSAAASTLDKASDIARMKYDNTDALYGIALDHIAQLSIKIGQYDKAQDKIKLALKILDEFRKDERYVGARIHAIETEAKLYGIQGLFDEAEENLSQSRKMVSKADVVLGSDVSGAEELAALFIQLGRFSAAEDILEKQIPEYEKLYGLESLKLIEPLVNRGRISLAKGDYTEAERTALRANRIALKVYGENSTKSAPTQKLLSDIYYTLGDYDKAETSCVRAIASQEKQFTRMHIEVAKSLSQLALIKFYKGDNAQTVERLLLEARDIMAAKLGKGNPQYAEILKSVAVLYISQKKYDVAFNSLTVAEGIWKAKTGRKNNINLASIFTLTGDVYYQLKNYNKSEEFYTKSKDLYEKFFSVTHPEYVKVLSKLGKVAYMKGEYKRSKKLIEESLTNYESFIKQYFPALSEREKAKYWNTIKGDFEFYNTLAFSNLDDFRDLTGKIYNYQLLTKALLLSSSIKIRERIMNSSDEPLKNQYSDWIDKKEQLTLALSMNSGQLADAGIDPGALQQEVERLEKDLSQKSEIFGQAFETKRITYEDVKKVLKANEVAMELVRYRYFNHTFTDSVIYAALYVTKENSKPKAIILPDGKKMEGRNFKFYRNAITTKIPDQNSYNVYWKTISEALGQTSTLYLSADGIYNQINLESIQTPDGRYIIDNSNIVLVSNTKDIYLRSLKPAEKFKENTATMFGNPSFYLASAEESQTITALPGTEREVNQLQFMLKEKGWATAEYIADAAAEEKIKEMNSPKIFHIATHGMYRPTAQESGDAGSEDAVIMQNPLLRTGLLLKGAGDLLKKTNVHYNMESGILTAYEAMSLNLDKTDLVVLSACETGLGDLEAGEGVYGLQRAFLVAGAKVLIMSMFKVDDEATQKLMLKFYQKWLNSGNMRLSFIEAKKELRLEYPEPIYWGAFMMIGLE
jgi:CHAT domain-containing protein